MRDAQEGQFDPSRVSMAADLDGGKLIECHRHVVWGPICFASRIDDIPPITGRDQAPLLGRLVDCMNGTVSLNEGGSGRIGE